jgi:hypothetical protein
MRTRVLSVVAGLFLCAAPISGQQGTSEIGGQITDSSGGVLPGISLTVTNEDTGVFRETVSGSNGSYFVSQMVPGRYRITAKLQGFKTLDRRGIILELGKATTIDLTMEVGGLAETVSVTGEAPLVDVSSAEVGGNITAQELNDLPSASRSYMAFVGNVPGAIFVPSAEFLNDTLQANGQPAAANNVVIDGANNTDDLRGSNVGGQARSANESLQEVQVITNQFDAEYGRASGAVINAVTKSGSNQLSGSGFDFFTGNKVTSRDFFTKVNNADKPSVSKQEWGGTAGGPIVRNKLFYFGSLERVLAHRPWAKTFPTRPEISYSVSSTESAWNTMWRIDHQLNAANTWAFRWLIETAPQFNRLDGAKETKTSYGDETDKDQTLVGTLTSVVSDTKVNTIRFGATLESTVHSNPAWRSFKPEYARCDPCPDGAGADQALVGPTLSYDSFDIQANATMDYSLDSAYSLDDTFSWFIPNKKGRHDVKFGARYTRTWVSNPNWANINGTYTFSHDLVYNPADPRTYPNRFSIRVPGALDYDLIMHVGETFLQDKWQIKPGFTVSAGIRYDLEVAPIHEDPGNPLFKTGVKYPVDKNNVAPRLGVIWSPDGNGKSVVRAGYGLFYDRTLLGTIDNFLTDLKYAPSFTASFPTSNSDPGPAAGLFPAEFALLTGTVSEITPALRAYLNALYPPGSVARNTGTVTWDDPERKQPYFHQISAGYEREVFKGMSVSADYVRMIGNDLFFNPDLNIGTRVSTNRSATITRTDPFGLLTPSLSAGEAAYSNTVRLLTTKYGYSNYDALDLSVEKRYSHNWSVRGAYSLSYSRGVTAGQGDTPQLQVGTNLNISSYVAPAGADRRHNLVLSGRMEVPRTRGITLSGTLRVLSGTSFTIQDDTLDNNQNGILFEPLPAGTYNALPAAGQYVYKDVKSAGGRNGARGPGFVQLDMRFGYRLRMGGRRSLDAFVDIFNLTNRVNFTNPSGNMRVAGDFLRFATLTGGSGFPRQAQLGLRMGF